MTPSITRQISPEEERIAELEAALAEGDRMLDEIAQVLPTSHGITDTFRILKTRTNPDEE